MTRLLEWEDAVHARFLAAKFLRERLSVGVCGVENKREQTRLPGGFTRNEKGLKRGLKRRKTQKNADFRVSTTFLDPKVVSLDPEMISVTAGLNSGS